MSFPKTTTFLPKIAIFPEPLKNLPMTATTTYDFSSAPAWSSVVRSRLHTHAQLVVNRQLSQSPRALTMSTLSFSETCNSRESVQRSKKLLAGRFLPPSRDTAEKKKTVLKKVILFGVVFFSFLTRKDSADSLPVQDFEGRHSSPCSLSSKAPALTTAAAERHSRAAVGYERRNGSLRN